MKTNGLGWDGFNPTQVRLRPYAAWPILKKLISFNPTQVRLRPGAGGVCAQHRQSFNPTQVRLRRRPPPPVWHTAVSFQSHTGTITTFYEGHAINLKKCFNPTQVRLRPPFALWANALLRSFNPTQVRLRPRTGGWPLMGPVQVSIPHRYDYDY